MMLEYKPSFSVFLASGDGFFGAGVEEMGKKVPRGTVSRV